MGGYTIDGLLICENLVQIPFWMCHSHDIYHEQAMVESDFKFESFWGVPCLWCLPQTGCGTS
ncbi:hypothetical protein JHK82_050835 [Glycine max]|uniref:Uncharacterized protein n=1 Tax=Glycine max TaxID=3847 RepID=K7MT33_SOYBN|nr:hypothetical protein JHK86_050692 [Glycine max]KAG4936614.1 hypothetical protein JHK85_051533 [Glycine max]KAG5092057.1 hypothetical protein JHK82_050835 [Glycine max]KAG5095138.1 hypothetical protein JHK84_050726 [Glycine max]KAH1155002.1 hypothetical protein GYH30_050342 [Glycine max]